MNFPATRPKWSAGNYSVWVGDTIIGYFVRTQAAIDWATFEAQRNPDKRCVVQYKGEVRFIASNSVSNLLP